MSDKLLYILPGIALLIFTLLNIGLNLNFVPDTDAITYTVGTSGQFAVLSDLSLGVSIPSSTILDITPTANGQFEYGNLDVTVSTSNQFGYSLVMNAEDPITSSATTSLKRTTPLSDGTTYPTIDSISGSLTAAQFASSNDATDKWGYSLDNGANFSPVASSVTINDGSNPSNANLSGTHTETVTFGAKLSDDKPYGTYAVTLNFVVTATPPDDGNKSSSFELAFGFADIDTYNGYYKMQDMNSTICGYVYEPKSPTDTNVKSIQLIDARDNKVYWVTKLMDGRCWMTQNLDFDINDTTKQYLTSEYTDLVASGTLPYSAGYTKDANGKITWTPVRNTIVSTTTGASFSWPNDPDTPYTIDLGNWYYRSDYYNNDDCGDQGCNYHTGSAGANFSQTAGANGAHSHVGNYYNWSAAVASNNTNGYTSGTPSNSICPKGWKLPANGGVNDNGTYSNLNKLYNGDITTASELGSTAAADKLLLASPLYFVRAGHVWSSALRYAGRDGLYWSSTVVSASSAYNLGFRSSGVWPSHNYSRVDGRSVRCLAAQ